MSLDLFKTLAWKKGVEKNLHKFSKWDEGVTFWDRCLIQGPKKTHQTNWKNTDLPNL